jgi:spore coat protein U-like protein
LTIADEDVSPDFTIARSDTMMRPPPASRAVSLAPVRRDVCVSARALFAAALAMVAVVALPSRVQAACTISTTGINFGDYSVFSTTPDDSSGSVTFRCGSPDRNIRVTLSPGGSGNQSNRQMRPATGNDRLNYNLYSSATRNMIWGDGTGGTVYYYYGDPPNNQNVNIPFYGRIPAQQDVAVGVYTDTVIATINF